MLLVLVLAVQTKTMVHAVDLTVFLPLLVKDPFVPEVLTSFYCRFFVEVGHFNQLHLGSHFFHLLTPPRFGALTLTEVNQFTGNSFRMVGIVLKITFLKLRYPKGETGRLLLCPIKALVIDYGSVFVLFY